MGHDASKVLLGSHGSSDYQSSPFPSDPATFLPGLAVREKSTGELSLSSADGQLVGVSLGASLSDTKKTAVARCGNLFPLRVTEAVGVGTVTISSVANLLTTTPDEIEVAGTSFTAQSGAATPGDATFRAATDVTATAASLALQINSHDDTKDLVHATSALGVVTITALEKGEDGNLTLSYTDNGSEIGASVSGATMLGGIRLSDYAAIGQPVIVSNSTGKAADSGTTTGAIYASDELQGIDSAGVLADVTVALIDMGGGL